MSIRRKVAIAVILAIIGVAAYIGCRIAYTVHRIPEAYAAWDTGTLLVEYMKSHDGRWPSSWDDLLSVTSSNASDQIIFCGGNAGDTNYPMFLRGKVAIDWKFDPARNGQRPPVTQLNGAKFPVVWEGAEPNEMVYKYLKSSKSTNAPETTKKTAQ